MTSETYMYIHVHVCLCVYVITDKVWHFFRQCKVLYEMNHVNMRFFSLKNIFKKKKKKNWGVHESWIPFFSRKIVALHWVIFLENSTSESLAMCIKTAYGLTSEVTVFHFWNLIFKKFDWPSQCRIVTTASIVEYY